MALTKPDRDSQVGNLISLDAAARLLMLPVARMHRLCRDGYIDRPKPGKTTIVSAVRGYIRFLTDERRKSERAALKARDADIMAQEIWQRLDDQKSNLITRKDALHAVGMIARTADDEFRRLPAKITEDAARQGMVRRQAELSRSAIASRRKEISVFLATGNEAILQTSEGQ